MNTGPDHESDGERERGAPAVFVIAGREEGLGESVCGVLAHTPADVPVVLVDLVGMAPDSLAAVKATAPGREIDVRSGPGAADLAALAASAAPADLVLIDLPCRVAEGWLEGLRAAAYSSAAVASATALSTAELPGADGIEFEPAAAAVRAAAAQLRPRISEPAGACRYLRRSAIDLAGAHGPGFAGRCLEAGLAHVIADEVLVDAPGRGPEPDPSSARALSVARRALGGLSVVIDARILDGPTDGTRVHVLELIAALGRSGRARVNVLVPPRLGEETRAALGLAPGVALFTLAPGGPPPRLHADVAHRPFQISAHADLTVLGQLADRVVITHQDLISYHNPAYFPSPDAWAGYREMTARALRAADRVVFFSAHVRDDAQAEELVEPHRSSVVALGVDHVVSAAPAGLRPTPPPGAEVLAEDESREVILCLGTDFRHKNRLFALRLVAALQQRHDWPGRLVLAGPRVAHGSSREQEQRLRAEHDRLAAAVIDLDAVTESEKQWLLERAALVLYPTVHEGFGLVPFEAAAHGRPCLWAAGTALSELLPDAAAGIVAWDASVTADRALALMRDPQAARANRAAIATAATNLRWDHTAARLIDVYHSVCDAPPSPVAGLERDHGLMREGLSDDAVRLVGPGGALPRDLERPLLALATHQRLSRPVLGAIRAAYRASLRCPRPPRKHD